jgi:hypothetical protein
VTQTGDPGLNTFIGFTGRWFTVPTVTTFPVTTPAGTTIGINYKTTASAGVTVSFSGGSLQAGSPDTVDVFAVQTTQSACGALPANAVQGPYQQGTNVTLANQFPLLIGGLTSPGSTGTAQGMHLGTGGNGLLADGAVCCQSWASGFQANPASNLMSWQGAIGQANMFPLGFVGAKGVAAGFTENNFLGIATNQFYLTASGEPAFSVFGRAVNPVANTTILHQFFQNTASVNAAYKFLTLSCSAACEIFVNRTSALGTTCTALTVRNLQLGNNGTVQAAATGDLAENACATQPTATYQIFDISLGAGGTQILDLTGFVNFHNATAGGGIDVVENSAVAAGNVSATLTYMEQ